MNEGPPGGELESFAGTARFEIIRKLGSGAMGTVYEAFDRQLSARVAIKTLHVSDPEHLLRLKREFRSVQDISSPHLARYSELVQDAGRWFFTMELVEGTSFLGYVWPGSLEADLAPPTDGEPWPLARRAPAESIATGTADREVLYHEQRLRHSLTQLAHALLTLHAHGMVHRDVKPANVLVNDKGRVVLVDLGLVLDSSALVRSVADGVKGTVAYMAPEQGVRGDVGPPADWYAFGVMLYQALVGRFPFEGLPLYVLQQKQQGIPNRPSTLVPAVPADLDRLCMDLLSADPDERPNGAEIIARLHATSPTSSAAPAPAQRETPFGQAAAFIGRESELAALGDALDATRRGAPVVVLIRGESGVGKTALVRAFIERLLAASPDTVVLAGRCFERESVPYKGLDSVIDALARYLQQLPHVEAAALRPRRASAMLHVFPVLGRVSALRNAPKVEIADPQELRTKAFEALRELFEKLCEAKSLVLLIDDFHWADNDSLVLLAELLAPPNAPPLLGIGTWRTGSGTQDRNLLVPEGISFREIELGRLDPEQATALARRLLPSLSTPVAARVAKEAGGHPLFIGELARAAADPDAATLVSSGDPQEHREGSSLESVLWRRVQGLDDDERRIVEALSVSETPVRGEPLAAACALSQDTLGRAAARLQANHVARAASERGSGFLDVYHARIREAVRARLSQDQIAQWHTKLAAAIAAIDPDAHEALALHSLGAGDTASGIAHAVRAAQRADSALAFDQAAALYRMALGILPSSDPRSSELHERLGSSLANAGRGAAAAQSFRAAMAGAAPQRVLDLQWRAAEQLVKCGHIHEGLEETRSVLSAYRLPFPKTGVSALIRLLSRRAEIAVRMKRRRPAARARNLDLERRFDICWSTGTMLAYVDSVRGALIQAHGLLVALRLGDANRLARALLVEAAFTAAGGVRSADDSDRICKLATDLVVPGVDAVTDAWVPHVRGIMAYLQGRWAQAIVEQRRAFELQARCTGVAWDTSALSFITAQTLAYAGHLEELERLMHTSLRIGAERGDRFLTSMIRAGFQAVVWLAADQPAVARANADAAVAEWSQRDFHLIHYNVVVGQANIDLYERQPERALARIQSAWASVRNAMFFQFEFNRIEMIEIRARAAIAGAADSPNRAALLRRAKRDIGRIERERSPWGGALAASLRAALTFAGGRRDDAIRELVVAAHLLDTVDMSLHAACVRWVLGEIDPDRQTASRQQASAYFERERVRHPGRLATMLVPGIVSTKTDGDGLVQSREARVDVK